MHWQHPPLCARKRSFWGSAISFPLTLGVRKLCTHTGKGGETPSCSLPPAAPGWHSSPSPGTARTLPGAVVGTRGWCLMQDVTFLHHVGVEAPGDTSGLCPEAAALPFAVLSRDAGEAAVCPGMGIVGTYFLHCVKQKQRKEAMLLYTPFTLRHNSQIKGRPWRWGQWADMTPMMTFSIPISGSRFTRLLTMPVRQN